MVNHFALSLSVKYIQEIDAAGELPLGARRRLRKSLENLLPDEDRNKFGVLLGLACAKRAWPVWRTAFPSESQPIGLAEAAASSIKNVGAISGPSENEFTVLKANLDNKFLLGSEYFSAIYAGFACWAVTRDAIFQDSGSGVYGDSELRVSPEDWDPCFFASLAVAGGAIWEGNERSDIRHEFWRWYLECAVPEAFAKAADRPQGEDRTSSSSQDPLF